MYDDGDWQIDPLRTIVHLRAKAFGRGVDCKVDVRSGSATIVDGGSGGTVTADIDLTTFRSNNDRRDDHVKSADFFDVAQHPLATFTASWQDGLPTTLFAELRVGEVTAPVTIDLTISAEASDAVTFAGTTRLSRRAFGITRSRLILADQVGVVVEGVASLESRTRPSDAAYGDTERRPKRRVVHRSHD